MAARAGVEPTTLWLKAIDSTKAPPCPILSIHSYSYPGFLHNYTFRTCHHSGIHPRVQTDCRVYIHVVHVQVDQTPRCLQELCYRETKTDASTVALFVDSVQINVLYVFRRKMKRNLKTLCLDHESLRMFTTGEYVRTSERA